jgi:hypothetical protein
LLEAERKHQIRTAGAARGNSSADDALDFQSISQSRRGISPERQHQRLVIIMKRGS